MYLGLGSVMLWILQCSMRSRITVSLGIPKSHRTVLDGRRYMSLQTAPPVLFADDAKIQSWYSIYKSDKCFQGYYTIINCPSHKEFSILEYTSKYPSSLWDGSPPPYPPGASSTASSIEGVLSEFTVSSARTAVPYLLHPEEIAFGAAKEEYNSRRTNIFVGGRIALRKSLQKLGAIDLLKYPILTNSVGAPVLSDPYSARASCSISHKGELAVGFVAAGGDYAVGVDIEKSQNKATDRLFNRILTSNEQRRIGTLVDANVPAEEEVMLLFSFKEAIYKAIHPTLLRPIGFQEVEVLPLRDGTCQFQFVLQSHELFEATGYWEKIAHSSGDYFVTFVFAKRI